MKVSFIHLKNEFFNFKKKIRLFVKHLNDKNLFILHVFYLYYFFLVTLNVIPIPFPIYIFQIKGGQLVNSN